MRTIWTLMLAFVVSGSAAARGPPLTEQAMLGTWECGPTTMHGQGFDVVIESRTTKKANHTFAGLDTSLMEPRGKKAITTTYRIFGTWKLDGDVVSGSIQGIEFLSSSDPTVGKAEGQKMWDEQLRKKSTYQSRILKFDGKTSQSVPIDSMSREAVVVSTCKRV